MRRAMRVFGWTMVWWGLFLLGYAGYQLFVTDLLNARAQEQARSELATELVSRRQDLAAPVVVTEPTPPATDTPDVTSPDEPDDSVTLHPEEPVAEGEPLGVLRIPSIGVDEVLFEGVTPDTLQLGPGHMPWTPVPGQPGNAVLSGHRTTYGRPFFDLDQLQAGDVIEVETAVGTHEFTVREEVIVSPFDVWVTEERRGAWLTLTTCHPRYSARQRLVVFAELTGGPNLEYVAAQLADDLEEVS